MQAALPLDEQARLAALRRYDILDTEAEQAYDDITRIAAYIAGTPIALVSLVDEERQWFKSRVGLDATETSRELAFCAHAILTPDQPLLVPDASADRRFADNPLVTGEQQFRFYLGQPLVTSDNFALGTLCVIDRQPRHPDAQQQAALAALSRLVVTQLELRRLATEREAYLAQMQDYQEELKQTNFKLEKRSLTDKLTGIANRAGFDRRLAEEIQRCQRYGSDLSLLLMDVDRFKHYNDSYGHLAGDEALVAVAKAMQEVCRPVDYAARYGGEEFAVILPETSRGGACTMAERLRRKVEATPVPHTPLTVSIGVSTLKSARIDDKLLIAEADKALYQAKGAGRNRVTHADDLTA